MTILELPPTEAPPVEPIPVLTGADIGNFCDNSPIPTLASCGAYLKAYETAAYQAKKEWIESKMKQKLALYESPIIEPMPKIDEPPGPPPAPEQVANVLERMRRILRHTGWTQGSMVLKGRRCLLGALHYALNGTDDLGQDFFGDKGAMHEACLAALVRGCYPITGEYVVAYPTEKLPTWLRVERRSNMARMVYVWNDHPRRTHREVQKMLKRQIKALRQG